MSRNSSNNDDDENNPFVAFRKAIDEQLIAATRLFTELPSQLNTVREDFGKKVEAADRRMETAFRRLGDAYERSTNPERTQIVRRGEPGEVVTKPDEQDRSGSVNRTKHGQDEYRDASAVPPPRLFDPFSMLVDPLVNVDGIPARSVLTWPNTLFFCGPYSPLRLETSSGQRQNGVPTGRWREAFEDLLVASKGERLEVRSMTATTPWWKRAYESPGDWLRRLEDRGLVSNVQPMVVQRLLSYSIPDMDFVTRRHFDDEMEIHPIQALLRLGDIAWGGDDDDDITDFRKSRSPDAVDPERLELKNQSVATKVPKLSGMKQSTQAAKERTAQQQVAKHLRVPTHYTTPTYDNEFHEEHREWLDFSPHPPPNPNSTNDNVRSNIKGYITSKSVTTTPDGTKTTKTVFKEIRDDGEANIVKEETRVEYMSRRQDQGDPNRDAMQDCNDDVSGWHKTPHWPHEVSERPIDKATVGEEKEEEEDLEELRSMLTKTKNDVIPQNLQVAAKQMEAHEGREKEVQARTMVSEGKLEQERNTREGKAKSWLWDW